MNWYDWVLIAPIVLGVILGFRIGLVKNILYIVLVAVTMIIGGFLSKMIVFRLERDVYNAQVHPAGPPPIIATSVSIISNLIKLLLINN